MKRLNYLVVISILGTLILAVFAFAPASADPPVINRVVLDFDFDEESCGFPIPAHLYGKAATTIFFNKDGEVRGWFDTNGGMSVTETWNGHTLTWHNVESTHWKVVGDGSYIYQDSGLLWGVSVPGYGRAVAYAGNYVVACHLEGEEMICDEELHSGGMGIQDIDAVCNYMINGK
jgi:hypothetical protein